VVIGLTATAEGPQRASLAALIAFESAIMAVGVGLVRISTRRGLAWRRDRSCSQRLPACCSGSPTSLSSTSPTRTGRCSAWSARGPLPRWARLSSPSYASARSLQLGLAVEVIAITSVAANLAAIPGGILVSVKAEEQLLTGGAPSDGLGFGHASKCGSSCARR
jgi:hypothetical protein